MPSLIDEHTQFTEDGIPIVGGRIYIGTANTDPASNLITIYSDRDLTTAIANPQLTDADGRAVNKIWVPGKYSIQVNDSAGLMVYQALDAGDLPQTGITRLINVQGQNTITAEGDPLVSTLTDGQQYNFRAVSANTGAVTLQIDLTTAKAIKKQHDVALVTGDIEANQTVSVIYNATDDVFEMVSNPAIGDVANLTISGDLTYKGVVQSSYVVPAPVTNHIRAGNMQLWDGGASWGTILDIDSVVTQSTWESIGPADFATRGTSAAANLWDGMNHLPASATVLIVWIEISPTMTSTATSNVDIYLTEGDSANTSTATNQAQVIRFTETQDNTLRYGNSQMVFIPLGPTNQDFRLYWAITNATASINMYYRGFITDA